MTDLSWDQFEAGGMQFSLSDETPEPGFFSASRRAFLRAYSRHSRAEKILEELLSTKFLPLCLRHGHGKAYLLQMIMDVAEQLTPDGEAYDQLLSNSEVIRKLLVLVGKIPEAPDFVPLWSYFEAPRGSTASAEKDYWHLHSELKAADEWLLRELVLRSGFLLDRIDEDIALKENFSRDEVCATILGNYKQINKKFLNDDFKRADEGEPARKQRYAPQDGSGGVYKQVKLMLHEDLVPVLRDALAGANRNAWIEDAIVQKLRSEGVEFELPEQPPVPHK